MRPRSRVEITASAERDIFGIWRYIAGENPAAARRWVTVLRHQIDRLETVPLRGAVIPESADLGVEYRHLIHGRYRTIYRVEDDRVLVLRVIHGAQLLQPPE